MLPKIGSDGVCRSKTRPMNPDLQPFSTEKYVREHTPSFDDVIFTRRQLLLRSGMSLGALSLASVFGVNPFCPPGA